VHLEIREVVRAPLERVYALSTDIDRAREWLPPQVRTEKLGEGPLRVGTRYRETRPILGRLDTQVYEVTVLDPQRRSEVLADGRQGRFRFRLDYEAIDASTTRLTLSGEATGLGCLGVLAAPLVRRVMRHNMAIDLAGLKSWIERVK
jgi:carbon monoxide dehydrogenase subunit G